MDGLGFRGVGDGVSPVLKPGWEVAGAPKLGYLGTGPLILAGLTPTSATREYLRRDTKVHVRATPLCGSHSGRPQASVWLPAGAAPMRSPPVSNPDQDGLRENLRDKGVSDV
jgi:hypothetical protein